MTDPKDPHSADPEKLNEAMKKFKEKFSTLTDGEHKKGHAKKDILKKPSIKPGKPKENSG